MRTFPNCRLRFTMFAIALLLSFVPLQGATAQTPVNVNTADLATLETLPGVGAATAQKIIDGRPYHSMADLEKVKGLGKTKADALEGKVTFGSGKSSKSASTSESKKSSSTAAGGKVNVNTADLATLETLPGVGAATAQKIIDGRPYSSLSDLERVKGLGKSKVEAMKDQITFGSTASNSKSKKSDEDHLAPTGESSHKLAPGEKVNINTANAAELDKLYGIGHSKAQAIIDYRKEHGNFQSPEDIMKVNGIKQGEFDKIKDNITVR